MTHAYRYLSLFILPLLIIFSSALKTYGQCPVTPSYTFANTCLADFEIAFTNTSTPGTGQIASYYWDFGDGTNSTAASPTHVFPASGTYTVYLFVYDTSGCYDSVPQNVVASQLPVASYTSSVIGCRLVSFNNTSTYSGTNPSWLWDFGDPASGGSNTSVAQNPQHNFSAYGTYSVSLTVTDSYGCSNTTTQSLTFTAAVVDFTWDSACANSPVNFTDLSSSAADPITGWLWDFGDGNSSNLQHPTHIYTSGGLMNVSLTVTTQNGCSVSFIQGVYINLPPVADFQNSLTCWDGPTNFFDDSFMQGPGQIVAWSWNFGDGNTSTVQDPVHTFALPGTYTVSLQVTDDNDCSASVTQSVDVFMPPITFFSATEACEGTATVFTDQTIANPIPIANWAWDFGDGLSSTLQNPTHLYAAAGTYSVSLTVTNVEGCSDTYTDDVIVRPNPVASFAADTACLGEVTGFIDLSQPVGQITSWLWDFGDPASGANNSSFLQNPNHQFTVSGSFSVTLTVTDVNGCMNTISQNIWVEPLPIANFSFLNQKCVGETVAFNNLSVPGNSNIQMWAWDFGDGTYDTIYAPGNPSVEHVYNSPGAYLVTLFVESELGCTSSVTKTMNIIPAPTADFTFTHSCEGMQTQFTDLTSLNGGAPIIQYWWDFGDPLSGGTNNSFFQNPQHIFTGPGIYYVSLIVRNNNNCSDTVIKPVEVFPEPPVAFTYDAACEGEPTQFYIDNTVVDTNAIISYLWDFDDGGFSNLRNPQHIFPGAGTYNVQLTVTDTSLCEGSISQNVIVDIPPVSFFDVSEPTCESDSVWFDDLSSTTFGFLQTWIWDFDDGSPNDTIHFPDDPNTYHIYNAIGTYGPTLTVINSQGCTHEYTRIIDIDGKPIANFHWSANPCMDEEVQFTDNSFANGQGNIITWEWNFDDPLSGANNNSVQENPIHVFTSGGTFYVRLIVTNFNDCRDTIIKAIQVNESPDVAFVYDISCEDTLTFFYPDTTVMNPDGVISWYWDFGDGQSSTDPYPAHNYEVSGYYNVTLTIVDTGICTNSVTQEIYVNSTPTAHFDVSEITCMNSPVFFEDLSSVNNSYIVQWTWDFGDGADTTIYFPDNPDVTHIYALDGNYQVTLSVVSNDTCYADESTVITIDEAPIALFDYDVACFGEFTQFWDNSSLGGGLSLTNWFWDFDDPASAPNHTSTLQNPMHDFSGPGNYNVMLAVTNVDGCVDTIIQTVTVNAGADVDFYSIDTCHTLLTQFFIDPDNTDTTAIIVYDWDFGDGSLHSSAMNPTHLYADPGIYDVTLTIIDTNFCTNTIMHEAEVRENPVALFDYDGACKGDSTWFSDLSYTNNGDLIVAWEWDFDDPASGTGNTSTLQNPAHVFTTNTTYDVKLVVTTDFGCRDSVYIPVSVHLGPQADFTYSVEYCQSGQVRFFDESTAYQTAIIQWEWYFEPGSYAYVPSPVYNYQYTDTTYQVMLVVTDANGCTDTAWQSIYVPPVFEIAIEWTQACLGDPMSFNAMILQPAQDSIFAYNWNFGEPASGPYNTSPLAQPVHTYLTPGWFTVTLTATDINGCQATTYTSVYVDDLPIPDFTYEYVQCDSLINFIDNSSGNGPSIQSWIWDFGDGSPPVQNNLPPGNAQHNYSQEGTYTVTLTIVNSLGCIDSISKEVEVAPCIYSEFYVLNDAVCEQSNIYFADSSGIEGIIEQWYWDFGDGKDTIYYAKAPVIGHRFDDDGDYEVRLIVAALFNGQLITDTLFQTVTVNPKPEPEFVCQPVCFGETSKFYDSTSHSGFYIASWFWDFGTGLQSDTSDLKNPVFTYEFAGTYDVKQVIVNEFGCKDSIIQEVFVNNNPIAEFETSLACKGSRTYFTDLSDGYDAEVVDWEWFFNDQYQYGDTSDLQNVYWTYAHEGTYEPRLVIMNENGCRDTAFSEVLVHEVPTAAFDLTNNYENKQGSILLEDESVGAIEHLWNFGDGFETWGNTPPIDHIYEEEGSYEIYLAVWNQFGCPDTAFLDYEFIFKTLYIPNALCPEANDPEAKVFMPKGRNLRDYYIAVHDKWGNMLWESTKLDSQGRPVEAWDGKLDGELLPTGVYIWRASARFIDGTIWEGSVVGNNDGGALNTHGTVTLVR